MSDKRHRWPFGRPHWTCEQRDRRYFFDLSLRQFACLTFAMAFVLYLVDKLFRWLVA